MRWGSVWALFHPMPVLFTRACLPAVMHATPSHHSRPTPKQTHRLTHPCSPAHVTLGARHPGADSLFSKPCLCLPAARLSLRPAPPGMARDEGHPNHPGLHAAGPGTDSGLSPCQPQLPSEVTLSQNSTSGPGAGEWEEGTCSILSQTRPLWVHPTTGVRSLGRGCPEKEVYRELGRLHARCLLLGGAD